MKWTAEKHKALAHSDKSTPLSLDGMCAAEYSQLAICVPRENGAHVAALQLRPFDHKAEDLHSVSVRSNPLL